MQRYMKIHSRMSGMSTEQGATHEESSTFTPLVRGYSEATQNTLNVSGRGILSKSSI